MEREQLSKGHGAVPRLPGRRDYLLSCGAVTQSVAVAASTKSGLQQPAKSLSGEHVGTF